MISDARIAELTDYREAKAKDGFAFCQIPTHELAALIARLASAEAALKPFWEACSHLHPAIPDDGETLDGFKVRDFRAVADHFAKLKDTDHD